MDSLYYEKGHTEVLNLLYSDAVTPVTRQVLKDRLVCPAVAEPRFFDAPSFLVLKAVCSRLIPQQHREIPIDLPGLLDGRLADGTGKGWRYDALPPDANAYRLGIAGIDESAGMRYGKPFPMLDAEQQDGILSEVQQGTTTGSWQRLDAARFFEELLVAVTELYYSHPLAKAEIGDLSFADAHGWMVTEINNANG